MVDYIRAAKVDRPAITAEDMSARAKRLDEAAFVLQYDAWALERENRAHHRGRTIYIPRR